MVFTPAVIRKIVTDNPNCVMLKHEDWPGLEKISTLRSFQKDGSLRPLSILCGNGGLFLDFEMERGADGAMTGYAFPELLIDVVRLSKEGKRDAAHDLFDAHLPLIRYEQQPGAASRCASTCCRSAASSPPAPSASRARPSRRRRRRRSITCCRASPASTSAPISARNPARQVSMNARDISITPGVRPSSCCVTAAAKEIEVFMMVRHHQIEFNSGALVFPGGSVDAGDSEIVARADLYSGGEGLSESRSRFSDRRDPRDL